jgi:hypothetical protein
MAKLDLVGMKPEVSSGQRFENQAQMLEMLVIAFGVDEDVVEIDRAEFA